MDYYQEIEKIRNRDLQRWFLTESQAKNAYGRIAELAAKRIEQKYIAPQDRKSWDKLDIKFTNLKKDKGVEGLYFCGENRFEMDKKSAFVDKYYSVLITVHEGVHAGQDRVAQSVTGRMPSPEHDLLCNTHHFCEKSSFGYTTYCNAYISHEAAPGVKLENDLLRLNIHNAQFVEREAMMEAVDVCEHLGIDVGIIRQSLEQAAQWLRSQYSMVDKSDAEVFRMLDSAQIKLIHDDIPKSAVEASMVYDLNTFQREQIAHINNNFDQQQFAKRMWDPDEKAYVLHTHGFKYAQVIPAYEIANYSIRDISRLSQIARDESPMFMSAAVCQYGEMAIRLLDKESYDGWYFSPENKLPQEEMTRIAEIMGPEYNLGGMEIGGTDQLSLDKEVDLDSLCQCKDMNIELDKSFIGDRLEIGFDGMVGQALEAVEESIEQDLSL